MKAYYFRSFCGKTIDVKHAKAADDAEVFQYDYNGNANQIWIFSSWSIVYFFISFR